MSTIAIEIIIAVAIFVIGIIIGFTTHIALRRISSHDGVMRIAKDDEGNKTIFSLELNDNPETFSHREEIIFKVVTSD